MHGLALAINTAPPYPVVDVVSSAAPFFDVYYLTLANLMAADGWHVIYPPEVGDQYVSSQSLGITNDISGDSGSGSRFLSELLLWGQYINAYINRTYSPKAATPRVYFGFSWGAYTAITLAKLGLPMTAYGAHCPATILANINPVIAPNFVGLAHGADILTTDLNGITIPGVIGYGMSDSFVGYDTAGTGGTPVSNTDALITAAQTFNSSTSLPVRYGTTDNHAVQLADTQFYANASTGWLATNVDTSCPRFF